MNTLPRPTTIPEGAKRVYEGTIFEVYEWPETMYDGTVKTFEKLKRLDTAIVIPVTSDGKILVAMQEQPTKPAFLGTIGGRIEKNEDPLEAAKRELQEETGYVSNDWEFFSVEQPVHKIDWNIYTYIARSAKKESEQNLDAGEKIEPVLLTLDELTDKALDGTLQDPEFSNLLLKARLDPEQGERLQRLLFGNTGL